jgi:hypothetical protein
MSPLIFQTWPNKKQLKQVRCSLLRAFFTFEVKPKIKSFVDQFFSFKIRESIFNIRQKIKNCQSGQSLYLLDSPIDISF